MNDLLYFIILKIQDFYYIYLQYNYKDMFNYFIFRPVTYNDSRKTQQERHSEGVAKLRSEVTEKCR